MATSFDLVYALVFSESGVSKPADCNNSLSRILGKGLAIWFSFFSLALNKLSANCNVKMALST